MIQLEQLDRIIEGYVPLLEVMKIYVYLSNRDIRNHGLEIVIQVAGENLDEVGMI